MPCECSLALLEADLLCSALRSNAYRTNLLSLRVDDPEVMRTAPLFARFQEHYRLRQAKPFAGHEIWQSNQK